MLEDRINNSWESPCLILSLHDSILLVVVVDDLLLGEVERVHFFWIDALVQVLVAVVSFEALVHNRTLDPCFVVDADGVVRVQEDVAGSQHGALADVQAVRVQLNPGLVIVGLVGVIDLVAEYLVNEPGLKILGEEHLSEAEGVHRVVVVDAFEHDAVADFRSVKDR